jgi:apolipoprotein N-acyltransferase
VLNLALALATAVLLVLTFPGFGFAVLAVVALAPLLVAMARERSPLRRFLIGEAAGIVYWCGTCYWIQFVMNVHGGMGVYESWGAFLLFGIYKALQTAVFALAAGPLMRRAYAVPAVAALWVAIERTHGTFGFAWHTLGNAGIDMSVPLRLAPFTGVYGLSFMFVMLSAALALVALRRRRREMAWVLALPLLYLLPRLPEASAGLERATLVQPNISETEDWNPATFAETLTRLRLLTLQAAGEGSRPPRLVVWPEVPAPFLYDSDPVFRGEAQGIARSSRSAFLFGAVAHTPSGAPLNSAFMIGPGGEDLGRYDKMYLVPFGEFVPPLFGFVNRITQEAGDFAPGTRIVLFHFDGHSVGTFICYEAALPHSARRFAAAGAEVFVNISNDGYFGHSAARDQHLKIVRMRAVENRRWILRSTNNGITAAIDPAGRVLERLPVDRAAALQAHYSYVSEQTVYTRYGDWFPLLCAAASLLALAHAASTRGGSPERRRP